MKIAVQVVLLIFAVLSCMGFVAGENKKQDYLMGAVVFFILTLAVQIFWA